ncbi:MAG TPA: tetratricopeptide repeat protein [Candidatus Omnitrophica bacterium]|nr:tetratricopeptide repeat protein [Candidatus Omnitrophota bacterium]
MRTSFIILLIMLLLVASLAIFSYLQNIDLKSQLNSTEEILKRTQEINEEMEGKLEDLKERNERIRADSISILNQNNRFQNEIKDLKDKLKDAESKLKKTQQALQRVKSELTDLKKSSEETREALKEKIVLEKTALKEALANVKKSKEELLDRVNYERAIYHYNLAVAYTKAKLYDEAIKEYKESLTYNENNPEAYYNLGLLYEEVKDNLQKAIWNYTKYIELAPDASDRVEVERWIRDLETELEDRGIWKSPGKESKDNKLYKGKKESNIGFGERK